MNEHTPRPVQQSRTRYLEYLLVVWIASALAFGVWQGSFFAGVWWFFGVAAVDIALDRRPRWQWLEDEKRNQEYDA